MPFGVGFIATVLCPDAEVVEHVCQLLAILSHGGKLGHELREDVSSAREEPPRLVALGRSKHRAEIIGRARELPPRAGQRPRAQGCGRQELNRTAEYRLGFRGMAHRILEHGHVVAIPRQPRAELGPVGILPGERFLNGECGPVSRFFRRPRTAPR